MPYTSPGPDYLNGKPCMIIIVFKRSTKNPVETSDRKIKNLDSHHCIQRGFQGSSRGKISKHAEKPKGPISFTIKTVKAGKKTVRHRTDQCENVNNMKGQITTKHLPKDQLKEWAI